MKEGEILEVQTKDKQSFKGLVIPSTNKNIIMLKLDSGYNLGINKANISKSKIIGKAELKEEKKIEKAELNRKLKTVLILHTGGTIASKISYSTGAVSPSFKPEEMLSMFPELKAIANIKSKLVGNFFSEDIRFAHFNMIAK